MAVATLVLDNAAIQKFAPSVFAQTPWDGVSPNYRFVPTCDVLDVMRDNGFVVTKAMQSRSRIPGKSDFTKHLLRLRHRDNLNLGVNDEIPEIVLVNSHDRTSAYNLYAGIFRLVCSNGLVVQTENFGGTSIRHSGKKNIQDQVIEATYEIVSETPRLMDDINRWKAIPLTDDQRLAFATAALELKDNPITTPEQLLTTHRFADKKNDVWSTGQVIQENMIKGGNRGKTKTGRRTTTRAVKSVNEDIRLNRSIFTLTETMAKLATSPK